MEQNIAFMDLRVEDEKEADNLLSAIKTVLLHGRLVNGPEVSELEKRLSGFCNRKYGIGINSGTDSLFLGFKSLGIGSGDEVITTSLSWIATANAIALNGATPVFADIGDDLNIDPKSVEALISPRTKAIMPVHYTGRICDMNSLEAIAKKHGLFIVEDASQAFGAEKYGRKAGAFGDMACFSMNPMKVFASCGEAGMVVTDDREIYEKLRILRYNGTVNRETCIQPSLNGRLDTIQAAVLLERLKLVPKIIQKRREIALWYNELLEDIVRIPFESADEYNVYYTYTIRADRRDKLKEYLASKGIETKIQHPILMPEQPPYQKMPRADLKNAKELVQQILCIPANEKITREQVEYISRCIIGFYGK